MKKRGNLVWLSILIVIVLMFGGIVLQLGGRMSDVYAEAELLADGRTRINACVFSSIGYVRNMELTVEGEEAYIDFYRTFGINQPIGAQNEFIVRIPRNVQRVYVWQNGVYHTLCTRAADGSWEKVK